MTPAVRITRRGGGLDIRIPSGGQPVRGAACRVAALEHAVQCGQVLGVFDAAARAPQHAFDVDACKRFEPQLLRLIQLRGVFEGLVVLVVVVQSEQREDLVDRVDAGVLGFSRPSCGL